MGKPTESKPIVDLALAPCPFCGSAAKEVSRFNANVITCIGCGAKVKQSEMGLGDAAERWNRRMSAPSESGGPNDDQRFAAQPLLTVWYGSMPETNGKKNWTAILHRKGQCISTGIAIDRSEYPDRVRYEADCMRFLIGEIKQEPFILDYDADKREPLSTNEG